MTQAQGHYFPEPRVITSLSGTEIGWWKKKNFRGLSNPPSSLWPCGWCLDCIRLCGSFSVYRLLSASESSVLFLHGYSFYCTRPGTGTELLFTSMVPGCRSLVWEDFFFCCVSVKFLFPLVLTLLEWPQVAPCVHVGNALSTSVKRERLERGPLWSDSKQEENEV